MATKGTSTLLASTANTAGSTTNSSSLNMTTYDGATLTGTMTNGGSAPTIACTATCQVSIDGTTWDTYSAATASAAASAVTPFAFDIPPSISFVRVSFSGNTGQSVTCICRAQYVSAL